MMAMTTSNSISVKAGRTHFETNAARVAGAGPRDRAFAENSSPVFLKPVRTMGRRPSGIDGGVGRPAVEKAFLILCRLTGSAGRHSSDLPQPPDWARRNFLVTSRLP